MPPFKGNTGLDSLAAGVVPPTRRKQRIRLSHSVSRTGLPEPSPGLQRPQKKSHPKVACLTRVGAGQNFMPAPSVKPVYFTPLPL